MHRMAKVAIAMLFVAGCGQGTVVATDFTDRQIFEGAIFGVGPVAELLPEARTQLRPELFAPSAEELSAMAQARAATIDAIERANPGLVADFAEAARSGDPARVQAMLARATHAISGNAVGVASAKPNIPIERRLPNIPIESAKPNIPIERRLPNIPIESAKPNIPIERRLPNIPIESAKPNIPIERRLPNIPAELTSVHPGWELLNSRLFSEQLSASVAATFGPRTVEH